MCGLCGIASFTGAPPDLQVLTGMIGRLAHRGPDGSGFYRDHSVALGHTRLAIIDAAGGAQPMASADSSVWVSFNGEIFNHVELRAQLRARGHRFRTVSDTEVVVAAWQEWGPECFARFNGQWAIAIWDTRSRRLVLSRDRVGICPLYYADLGGTLLFASEIKALLADPRVDRDFDPAGLDEVFTYWSTVAPRTVLRGVKQLEPGCMAVYDDTGLTVRPYWQPHFPRRGTPGGDARTNAQELRERLIEATRLRFLRSDVPVGAYLSGGLDSSIVAAVVATYTDVPVHTFSLRFDDAEFDEGRYQRDMIDALGTTHRDVVVGASDIVEVFPEVVRHTETPIVRAGPAPMYLLSKLVRDDGYRVVVTGEGADEMLAGYDLFSEARVRQFWARNPDSALRPRALELLYPWMERSPATAPAFAQSFFGRNLDAADPLMSHRPRWDSTSMIKQMCRPELGEVIRDDAGLLPSGSQEWDDLARAQYLETKTLLAGYILSSQGERMLMANSVEGRFPYLDPDVVDFANALPAHHKLFGLEEKYLLKRAFTDLVPAQIRHRPKQPYRAPDAASFFAGPAPDWFAELTSVAAVDAAGVFEPAMVANLFAKCARSKGRRMSNTDNMRVLAIVSTQLIHHDFVAGGLDGLGTRCPPLTVAVDRLEQPMNNHGVLQGSAQ